MSSISQIDLSLDNNKTLEMNVIYRAFIVCGDRDNSLILQQQEGLRQSWVSAFRKKIKTHKVCVCVCVCSGCPGVLQVVPVSAGKCLDAGPAGSAVQCCPTAVCGDLLLYHTVSRTVLIIFLHTAQFTVSLDRQTCSFYFFRLGRCDVYSWIAVHLRLHR